MSATESPPRRVLVINTGGTIGMADFGKGYEAVPQFMESHCRGLAMFHDAAFHDEKKHGPGLITGISKYGQRVYYEIFEYNPVLDSSDMDMNDWIHIASDIEKFYHQWDAFVVLHGTDTMAYTASALSYMLQDLGKTVVITGSQVPMVEQRNDGCANFQGALLVAGHYTVPEVCLFFSNKLYRGNRTTKAHSTALAAFDSPNLPPLMTFGIKINVAWDAIFRPSVVRPFSVQKQMDPNVCILRLFPGIKGSLITQMCQPPVRGVVLQSYGAGNSPEREDILSAFKAATDSGVMIINTTQCHGGFVEAAYHAGQILLAAGVLPGGDMTPESALTKLSYVLANESLDHAGKVEMLLANIRGERMVATEQEQFSFNDGGFIRSVARAMGASSAAELGMVKKSLAPVLLCSAARIGDSEWIGTMIEDGYDVNGVDYDLRSPLHIAAAEGQGPTVELLLLKGASIHAVDRFGLTPLRDAIDGKHTNVIEHLVECGATLHYMDTCDVGTILCKLALKNDIDSLAAWTVAGVNINAADYDGRTALHVACTQGAVEFVKVLFAHPAIDLTLKDIADVTAAEEAGRKDNGEIKALFAGRGSEGDLC